MTSRTTLTKANNGETFKKSFLKELALKDKRETATHVCWLNADLIRNADLSDHMWLILKCFPLNSNCDRFLLSYLTLIDLEMSLQCSATIYIICRYSSLK